MQKFFVKDNQIIEDIIEIIGTDVKHITNVLRLNIDEEISTIFFDFKHQIMVVN